MIPASRMSIPPMESTLAAPRDASDDTSRTTPTEPQAIPISRFAPSTTGQAHPGTLLSALLVWLDARVHCGKALLRLEDLDPERAKAAWAHQMLSCLQWLGLDWDATFWQSHANAQHEHYLDTLAARGHVYACTCSRARLKGGRRAPDGGWAYDNHCRAQRLTPAQWRDANVPLRLALPTGTLSIYDESGIDLSQDPAAQMGDPIIRRRDGAFAYQFAVVVDDICSGVNRVVRGRDIAPSTATQVALYRLLAQPQPSYRHHFLLLESRDLLREAASPLASANGRPLMHAVPQKLAKLHGSIPFSALQTFYSAPALLGQLAFAAGLQNDTAPTDLATLARDFQWARVRTTDLCAHWDAATGLRFAEPTES